MSEVRTDLSSSLAALAAQALKSLAKFQCGVKRDTVSDPPPSPPYGYLQIDNYAHKQKRRRSGGTEIGPKRWIPLSEDVKVHGAMLPLRKESDDVETREVATKPVRSCLKPALQLDRNEATKVDDGSSSPRSAMSTCSSLSTVASESDRRSVHFCDRVAGPDASRPALAEWIFVDRDICGFSLYNHHRESFLFGFEYFASSPYGRSFQQELVDLHARQDMQARSNRSWYNSANNMCTEKCNKQDQEFDDVLRLAGVEDLLVEDPEGYPQYLQVQ